MIGADFPQVAAGPQIPRRGINWIAVALFVLAGGIHYQVYFWAARLVPELPLPGILPMLLPAVGFALVAAIAPRFLKGLQPPVAHLWRGARDLMLLLGPLALLVGLSFIAPEGERIRAGMIGPVVLLFPALFAEEFGWRRFLQNQLRPMPRWPRYLLIAVLWQLCHVDFVPQTALGFLQRVAYALPMTVCITVLAGDLADRSRSILVVVALQIWVELVAVMPGWPVYSAFFVAFAATVAILRQQDPGSAPRSTV